jgi:hypothetical protein
MSEEQSVYWYYDYNNKCMQRGNSVTLYRWQCCQKHFHTPNGTGLENETNETKRNETDGCRTGPKPNHCRDAIQNHHHDKQLDIH